MERTRQEIERALDSSQLWVAINNGSYWVARRNGATRLWVKSPWRFRIPFKYGLRGYGQIDQDNLQSTEMVISATKPANWRK